MLKRNLSKQLLLEVGIPLINSRKAHRQGVEAPRDFKSIPNQWAICHHFLIIENQPLRDLDMVMFWQIV